jgi:hypothetical protein
MNGQNMVYKTKKEILKEIHFCSIQGSCCSSTFGNNISNYLTHMLDLTDMVTQPGSLTYEVN